jgi:DNA-binding NarL/FixJ family response regulator
VSGSLDGPARPITIATARFGDVFDSGLATLLREQSDFDLVAQRLEISELEAAVSRHIPQVVILGGMHVVEPTILARLRELQPHAGLLVLVHQLPERYGLQLFALGATACLPGSVSSSDLVTAIRLAAKGSRMLVAADPQKKSRDVTAAILTPREWEVLGLIQAGCSNSQIGRALHITTETVRTHVQRIYRKLGVTRRGELVTKAIYANPVR